MGVVVKSPDPNHTHTIMKYLVLALVLMAGSAFAFEEDEGRTLFTSSSGNMYLGLNDSTLLIGVIGLALLGGLLFVALQSFGADSFLPAHNKNSYDYSAHPDLAYANSALAYAQNQHEQHAQQYRRKRSPFVVNNLATKLTQLEKAFKKYEVET